MNNSTLCLCVPSALEAPFPPEVATLKMNACADLLTAYIKCLSDGNMQNTVSISSVCVCVYWSLTDPPVPFGALNIVQPGAAHYSCCPIAVIACSLYSGKRAGWEHGGTCSDVQSGSDTGLSHTPSLHCCFHSGLPYKSPRFSILINCQTYTC